VACQTCDPAPEKWGSIFQRTYFERTYLSGPTGRPHSLKRANDFSLKALDEALSVGRSSIPLTTLDEMMKRKVKTTRGGVCVAKWNVALHYFSGHHF